MIGAKVTSTELSENGSFELPVLKNARLKEGQDRDDLSKYGDDFWDLTPAVFRENARICHCTVKFDQLTGPHMADMMRAYLYARLNVKLPGWSPPLPPSSIRQAFNHIRPFFKFLIDELGSVALAKVDQAVLDKYATSILASKRRKSAANAIMLKPIWHLYHYRDYLPDGGLSFEPWPGKSAASVAGYNSRFYENQTSRIPEAILNPLLSWSFKYVKLFSKDILAARDEMSFKEKQALKNANSDRDMSRQARLASQQARVEKWLEMRASAKRGVPVWAQPPNGAKGIGTDLTPINWWLLNLIAGIDANQNPSDHLSLRGEMRQAIENHRIKYGIEPGGFDTEISFDPDTKRTWRSRFDYLALKREERMLQTACYTLCAYLTGMRDSEVQGMRSGCLDLTRSEDGLIERYRVRSTAHKSKRVGGSPADWITIAPVAEAIEVLEKLSSAAIADNEVDTLWPVLDRKRATKIHVSAEIVNHLNGFRVHVNEVLSCDFPEKIIPLEHAGKPFRITTRQFRRTLAWHIANRPFGTIAGMIQYKHASVAVFEGYAGSSHSGFVQQIDQEHRSGQLDDILEYFDAHQIGGSINGPASARIKTAIEDAGSHLSPLPARIADRGRLRVLLGSLARTLHVGVLADCFFDPATALCLKTATDQSQPRTALCQPTKCPNACIRSKHIPAWQQASDDAKALLKEKRLSKVQRLTLKGEKDRIDRVIAEHVPTAPLSSKADRR